MSREHHCCNEQSVNPEPPSALASPIPQEMIRLPQNRLARVFLGSLLLAHFGILFLNNLAWSPVIAFAWPYYAPYVVKSGLVQDWGMYRDPARYDQRIKVEGITEAGRQPISQDSYGRTSSRMLYFIEGLCIRNSMPETSIFLSWVYDQIPRNSRPEWGLVLRRDVKKIPMPTETKMKTVWRLKDEFFFWEEENR